MVYDVNITIILELSSHLKNSCDFRYLVSDKGLFYPNKNLIFIFGVFMITPND